MKDPGYEEDLISGRGRKSLAILEAIRRQGPLTKTDISKLVKLNIVTVSNYVNDFIQKRLILEKDIDVSTGGRRPVLVQLNKEAGYVIGIGFNLFNSIGLLVDLEGGILSDVKMRLPDERASNVMDHLVAMIEEILSKTKVPKDKIRRIGIGVAGLLDKGGGSLRWPERMGEGFGYLYVPIREELERKFGIPVLLENDATVAAFGEYWLSLDPQTKHVLFMYAGAGLGIVIDGEIYRGASGNSGEFAIHNPVQNDKFNCSEGNPCFLKKWSADVSIVSLAKKAIQQGQQSDITKYAGSLDKVDLAAVFKAAKFGDRLAVELVEHAGVRLGVKAAWLINLFNPEVLIIGGGLEEAGALLMDAVKKTISGWAFPEMANTCKVIPSRLGENAVALGAASLAVRESFVQA
ncbi:MAG: ROK family transcriptional regulator [Candidatus Omnitrophota bacterium]